jgi:hypothetical protein
MLIGVQTLNVMIVTKHQIINLNPFTGQIVSRSNHEVNMMTHRFIMIKTDSDMSALVAVPRGAVSNSIKIADGTLGSTTS